MRALLYAALVVGALLYAPAPARADPACPLTRYFSDYQQPFRRVYADPFDLLSEILADMLRQGGMVHVIERSR